MSTWLVIGSAPTVTQWLHLANDESVTTITCNSGIKLIRPDYYFAGDMHASRIFYEDAKWAQGLGTTLLTLKRHQTALKDRQVDHYDEFIELPPHNDVEYRKFGRFCYSGPLCVQYALVRGATSVLLIGMDGYRKANDYFDSDASHRKTHAAKSAENITRNCIAPVMRRIAAIHPDVAFRLYGTPAYGVGEPNWTVIERHET